jgi:hypothetical protein
MLSRRRHRKRCLVAPVYFEVHILDIYIDFSTKVPHKRITQAVQDPLQRKSNFQIPRPSFSGTKKGEVKNVHQQMFLGVERATQQSLPVHAHPTLYHGLAELALQSVSDDFTPAYYFAVPA